MCLCLSASEYVFSQDSGELLMGWKVEGGSDRAAWTIPSWGLGAVIPGDGLTRTHAVLHSSAAAHTSAVLQLQVIRWALWGSLPNPSKEGAVVAQQRSASTVPAIQSWPLGSSLSLVPVVLGFSQTFLSPPGWSH